MKIARLLKRESSPICQEAALEIVKLAVRVRRYGKPPQNMGERNGNCRYSDADVKRAIYLRMSGLSFGKIAAKIGCSPGSVKDWVRAHQIESHSNPS